jgi:D-aminopeptidase
LPPGPLDAITDVAGVRVGHTTLIRGDNVRTGVTVILPPGDNLFRDKVPGAVYVGNAFGKLMGSTQVEELGEIETPIALTSTLNVPRVADAILDYILALPGNEQVRSVNPLVAETNDGYLNDIRGRHVGREEVLQAIRTARGGPVEEGAVGAGTGTVAFGWKGGIGTASRKAGTYTVGVLVQTNFGGTLQINGAPAGRARGPNSGNGSCVMVVATDAPVDARNLRRMAARTLLGMARTGSSGANGSGDYGIAFSTARHPGKLLTNDEMSPLFLAVIEATQEAIYNSLLRAVTMTGNGHIVEALPIDRIAYFPPPDGNGGWRTKIEAAAALDRAFEYVKTSTRNGGLLVAHHGWLIYERYFGRGHRDALPNTASCGKSFTSVAAGILIAEHADLFPDGLDQKVYRAPYLPPEALPAPDPRAAQITLGQLLSMTAGVPGNNPAYVRGRQIQLAAPGPDGWQAMQDHVAAGHKLWCDPGEGYSYATSSIHLASMIVRHVSGMELEQFVRNRIAEPLGWGRFGWGYTERGLKHTPGGGGIALRATDMLRFGYLLLHEGRWGARQIVPREFVRACGRITRFNPHFPESLTFVVNEDGHVENVPRDAFWKEGSGGHCIYVVPSLDLVIWKLGGRDEQYPAEQRISGRETWKPGPDTPGAAAARTLQLVVEAVR